MKYFNIPENSIMGLELFGEHHESIHRHINTEIIFVLRGSLQLVQDNDELILEKEEYTIIPQNKKHSIRTGKETLYGCIHINKKIAERFVPLDLLYCDMSEIKEASFQVRKVWKMLLIITRLYLVENSSTGLLFNSECYKFLYYLSEYFLRQESIEPDTKSQKYYAVIEKWILNNYTEDIKLEDLASHLNLTVSYLSRFFKKLFGINFLDYLTSVRLESVCSDLINFPDRSILRIAYDNGFSNLASFNKMFKKKYQMPPSQFRSQRLYEKEKEMQQKREICEEVRDYLNVVSSVQEAENLDNSSTISCNLQQYKRYKKNWDIMINIGRAYDLTSSDMQKHITALKKELKINYGRIWGIYSDNMIVRAKNHRSVYDFTRLNRALDFLVDNGIHPYLDIGFKPILLLEEIGKPLVEKKIDYIFSSPAEFADFVEKFIDYYYRRYGEEEVDRWYFELWYDFRNQESDYTVKYLEYASAAKAKIRQKLPNAKFGGPGDDPIAFLKRVKNEFADVEHHVPFDFLSAYYFADDMTHGVDIHSVRKQLREEEYLSFWISRIHDARKAFHMDHIPLHLTEWGLTVSNRNVLNDSYFKSAYLIRNMFEIIDQVEMVGIWGATDLFAEYMDSNSPLFGGAGILNRNGMKKPSYHALAFLNNLDRYLIYQNESASVTSNGENDYYILCHNYCHPGYEYYYFDNETHSVPALFSSGMEKTYQFLLSDAREGQYIIKSRYVNEESGNIQNAWAHMEELQDLSRKDMEYLESKTTPQMDSEVIETKDGNICFKSVLQPNEIRLIHIYKLG